MGAKYARRGEGGQILGEFIKNADLQETKTLLHRKQNHQQNEKVNMEWERIFANLISDERLISKIYKNANNSIAETIQFKNGHRM